MHLFLFFLITAMVFTVAVIFGNTKKILPIVMQLSVAIITIPLMSYVFSLYKIDIAFLVNNNDILNHFYKFNFAILIGYILLDTIEGKIEKGNFKIALLSFTVPFFIGLLTSYLYIGSENVLQNISLALLFSITAVPVLHIILKDIEYPILEAKKLVQVAIIIDVLCWIIFALVKDYFTLINNIPILLLGIFPLVLCYILKLINLNCYNNSYFYGFLFFIIIFILEYLKYNIILFGIIYLINCYILKQEVCLPIKKSYINYYQKWIAVPFILTVGIVQIKLITLTNEFNVMDLLLLILPIISKIIGNYIGLYWYNQKQNKKEILEQSVLLNTRGLTEIVFLNMLFSFHIISDKVYLIIMIMGLISTLLPLLIKKRKI